MAKTLRAVKPNGGLRAEYRRKLREALEATHSSILWWARAAYRKEEDRIALGFEFEAEDGSPAKNLKAVMTRLVRRWRRKWEEIADNIGNWFVNKTNRAVKTSMTQALKDAGWLVKIPTSRVYNASVMAQVEYNVSLIKSIGTEYLSQVENLVMMSASMGGDVAFLQTELKKRFEISERRADFIARDQSNKVTEAIKLAQFNELGIKQAEWVHVPGLKTSRETHQRMDGKVFDVDEGLYDSDVGYNVTPAELPGCQCTMRPIIPEFGDEANGKEERTA